MTIPGVVWSALLVALPLLALWMQDSFPGMVWAAPVAGLLLIIAKTIEAVRPVASPPPGVAASEAPQQGAARRWLWG